MLSEPGDLHVAWARVFFRLSRSGGPASSGVEAACRASRRRALGRAAKAPAPKAALAALAARVPKLRALGSVTGILSINTTRGGEGREGGQFIKMWSTMLFNQVEARVVPQMLLTSEKVETSDVP